MGTIFALCVLLFRRGIVGELLAPGERGAPRTRLGHITGSSRSARIRPLGGYAHVRATCEMSPWSVTNRGDGTCPASGLAVSLLSKATITARRIEPARRFNSRATSAASSGIHARGPFAKVRLTQGRRTRSWSAACPATGLDNA